MLTCQKHLFSLDPDIHYLNCAYKSPLMKAGERDAIEALIRGRNPSSIFADDFFVIVEEVRNLFGRLVNCEGENVAIIPSVSYGMASVLGNINAEPGKKALTLQNEFPSGYFAIKSWCEAHQNDLEVVGPDEGLVVHGENWNKKLLERIDINTSIVLMSSVHWMNGLKFDLEQIGKKCAEVGAYFIVDGSQSVGALEMDVEKYHIDALICAGYKWLFGPYSISLAYIHDKFERGNPIEQAWMNRTNARHFERLAEYDENYKEKAGRYNMGQASNLVTMPILKEGLLQLLEWKVSEIQAYSGKLILPLLEFYRNKGYELEDQQYFSKHLFSLPLPKGSNPIEIKHQLKKDNIIVSIRGSSLRVSVNVFNDERDIQTLMRTVDLFDQGKK